MDKLLVTGGNQLSGSIVISGAKNAALPILASTILASKPVVLGNLPHLHDVTTTIELLTSMGAIITLDEYMNLEVNTSNLINYFAPYEVVKTMRSSILVLGALLGKYGEAKVSLPGGCAIGSRPVDLHIKALQQMGAKIEITNGYINAKAANGLKGAVIDFPIVTVTGTENIIMAAVLAHGTTIINNAAIEPEVEDLIRFLNSIGADISWQENNILVINGVAELTGGSYDILSDRIEAGTFLIAGAITNGHIKLLSIDPSMLTNVLEKLDTAGVKLITGDNWIELDARNTKLKSVNISTAPYPGFPTDMQAQFLALNIVAEGDSTIEENIFENRFMHVQEMIRMGADLRISGSKIICRGGKKVVAAPVMATDLRASAGLILLALAATGVTQVDRVYHVDRGYERIEEKLSKLGAIIKRVKA